jgi:glycosyltransferase involved in cell wall biosynthesis
MKTIIDGRLLLPDMTGIGRYLVGLAQGLSQVGSGHHFELWLQENLPDLHPVWALRTNDLSIQRLDLNHMAVEAHWRIPILLKQSSYDLFHYPHFDLPFFTPGKVVATIHDLKYLAHREFFPRFSLGKRALLLLLLYRTVQKSTLVITVSNSTREDLVRIVRADPAKIVVVPEGVDQRFGAGYSSSSVAAALSKYSIKKPYFLFVGEKRPHKNLVNAVKAFEVFLKQGNGDYQFIISGKTYLDYDEPEKTVEELGLKDTVQFIHIAENDLPMIYQAAEAFVTLSLYEGFGLPVLEAMASGVPVIAAAAASLPEIVGEAGILVDPKRVESTAAAMLNLTLSQALRDRLVEAGKERAGEFTWEKCAQKTLDVYLTAVSM